MTWKPDIFIYHHPCDDGFGAAFAAWRAWGDTISYYPTNYGHPPPDVTGKNVLIGDFSYKADTIAKMAEDALSIVILDHHKSAEADLAAYRRFPDRPGRFTLPVAAAMLEDLRRGEYPAVCALFDASRSGAQMVWDFCHAKKPTPELIRYIQDRDLWLFKDPDTKAISLYLRSQAYNFQLWDEIANELEDPTNRWTILREARGIERYFNLQVEAMASTAVWTMIDRHLVPTVNTPYQFSSDVAHHLLELHPYAPFAATYADRNGARGYSLRSEDARTDVSLIAKRYGGGGHRNAAGFEVPNGSAPGG